MKNLKVDRFGLTYWIGDIWVTVMSAWWPRGVARLPGVKVVSIYLNEFGTYFEFKAVVDDFGQLVEVQA